MVKRKKYALALTCVLGILSLCFLLGVIIVNSGWIIVSHPATPDQLSLQIISHHWSSVNGVEIEYGKITTSETAILVVDVRVTNHQSRPLYLDCPIIDAHGKRYNQTILVDSDPNEELLDVAIAPSETRRGKLAFIVPGGEQELWLDCGAQVRPKIQ